MNKVNNMVEVLTDEEKLAREEKATLSRSQQLGKWLLEREKTEASEVDKQYRMLKLNTFLTLGILALVGGQDNTDLLMSLIWFV
jgi:hypothetical protein